MSKLNKIKGTVPCFSGGLFPSILVLMMLTSLPQAFAQNEENHPGQHVQQIFSQLNLTDDQKKLLESNKQDHRARMEGARTELKKTKEELQQEIMAPVLNMVKINKLHSRLKALQNQMEDDKLESILAVRSILTAEQFTKFVSLMHKHKQEHEQ